MSKVKQKQALFLPLAALGSTKSQVVCLLVSRPALGVCEKSLEVQLSFGWSVGLSDGRLYEKVNL